MQNGRGTTLSDIFYDGELDIINGNWKGYHRAYVKNDDKFMDVANEDFRAPTKVRTVISADFDNDGYDEIFFNNIGEPNKLFRINDNGEFLELQLNEALEPNGLGTGAAVADINNDGVLVFSEFNPLDGNVPHPIEGGLIYIDNNFYFGI